jgi:hypothetical protein
MVQRNSTIHIRKNHLRRRYRALGLRYLHVQQGQATANFKLSTELTLAFAPAILCPITERNDNEQEEYAHSSLLREPAVWCEAGASAGAEWPWELRSEP